MTTLVCPSCGARGDLLEQWRESVSCACCGRSCLKADAERAARARPRPSVGAGYRKPTEPPEVSGAGKLSGKATALVSIPLKDVRKMNEPDYGP